MPMSLAPEDLIMANTPRGKRAMATPHNDFCPSAMSFNISFDPWLKTSFQRSHTNVQLL